MLAFFKKNSPQLCVLLLISMTVFSYYSVFYLALSIPLELRNFYLTLAYPTDSLNWKIMESLNHLNEFPQGKSFILYFFEIIIYSVFGFKYIWVTAPIFKSLSISIIFFSIKKLYKLDFTQQLILISFLFIILFTNNLTFEDRFSRPHITQILIPISYALFLKNSISKKNIYLIFSVIFLTLLIFSDPWLVCFFLIYYTTFCFLKKQFKNNFVIICSFCFCLISLYFIGNNTTEEFNSILNLEYLGLKEIYSIKNFIIDYYLALLLTPYNWGVVKSGVLTSFLLLYYISKINQSIFLFICLSCSLFFGWLPYVIIDYSFQSYHVIIAAKSFLIYISIFEIGSIIASVNNSFSGKQLRCLSLILLAIIINFDSFKSGIFKRADNLFKNYSAVFNEIKNTNQNCEIFSDDTIVRSYALAFTKNNLSVPDGFYEPIDLTELMKKINRTMGFIDKNYEFKSEKEYIRMREKLLHYATHNYFSMSSSLIAPSLKKQLAEFNQVKFRNTFRGWNLIYPDSFHSYDRYENIEINSGIIIIKGDYNYFDKSPKMINLCSP